MGIWGLIGAAVGIRTLYTASGQIAKSTYSPTAFGKAFTSGPLIQGGAFGVGYTGGAYTGYGVTNTSDVFGIHKPKYKRFQQSLGLPYGNYGGYRTRRYRSRYGRRYRSRYGYRRRSYYRRYY